MRLSLVLCIGRLPRLKFGKFLFVCLDLLNRQTLSKDKWELIISDYGSDSPKHIRKALDQFPDINSKHVFTPISKNHLWWNARCMNIGVKHANYKCIIRLNPDSWLRTDALSYVYELVCKHKQFLLLGRKYDLSADLTENILSGYPVDKAFGQKSNMVKHKKTAKGDFQVFLRRSYNKISGYDEGFIGRGADDEDFYDRMCASGVPYAWLDVPDFLMLHANHKRDGTNVRSNIKRYKNKRAKLRKKMNLVKQKIRWPVLCLKK